MGESFFLTVTTDKNGRTGSAGIRRERRDTVRRPVRARDSDRQSSPLAAGGVGALAGFLVGASFAIVMSGQLFPGSYPMWVWHLLAATYGLALGMGGSIRYRGWVVKGLSLVAPPAFAVLGSWVVLMKAAQAPVPHYSWFGTMAALGGAATGLLAGFSSRSLGGFAAGIVGGQLVAWPAGFLFLSALQTRMPYGLVVPMAFALGGGLTHLAIACALRLARADLLPKKGNA